MLFTYKKISPNHVFLSLSIFFVLLAVAGGVQRYSSVPFWDMWDGYLGFYVEATSGNWSAWLAQHNEHRIILARLFFWIDIALFQGRGWFLIVINYVLIIFSYLVFWHFCKVRIYSTNKYWFSCFLFAWLFTWIQKDNLTWGFQSQFILAQLLPLTAFYFLHRAVVSKKSQVFNFILAVLFGIIAMGSMANGVLTLPLMTAYALIVRMGWKRCFVLAILSVVCTGLYFYSYTAPAGHGSLVHTLAKDPLGVLHYVLLYVGGPFYYLSGKGSLGQVIATVFGIFLIVSSAFFAWRAIPNAPKSSLSLSLLTFILYIGGTALGTAGGRLIFGVDQALSGRYMTPALMAWAALFILYLPRLEKTRLHSKIWILFLVLLLLLTPKQFEALKSRQGNLFERKVAALALELGINDQDQISAIFPSATWALQIAEEPKARNLSIFGLAPIKDAQQRIGRQHSAGYAFSPQNSLGSLDEVEPVTGDDGYFRIRGWAFSPAEAGSPELLEVLDENNLIVGIALTGQPRPDVAKAIDPAAEFSGFKGYIIPGQDGKQLYLQSENSEYRLQIMIPKSVVNYAEMEPSPDAISVSLKHILPQNEWTGTDFNKSQIDGMQVFGSFIHSDKDTGSISLKIRKGDSLFYRSGPTRGRQFIHIPGSDFSPFILPVAQNWVKMTFNNKILSNEFVVRFYDNGTGWGEWSAIAISDK
jgi:hypothetical protein